MMADDITTSESIPVTAANDGEPPFSWRSITDRAAMNKRQLMVLLIWTALADLLVFRAFGLSGPAAFFCIAPILFLGHHFLCKSTAITLNPSGESRATRWPKIDTRSLAIVAVLLWLVGLRMVWQGSGLNVFSGVILLVGLAMTCSGHLPLVLEGAVYAMRVGLDGLLRITGRKTERNAPRILQRPSEVTQTIANAEQGFVETVETEPVDTEPGQSQSGESNWAPGSWLMPVVALIVFGGIFVMANPDLLDWVSAKMSLGWDFAWSWISGLSAWELPFCLCVFVLGAGLLMPVLPIPRFGPRQSIVDTPGTDQAPMYAAFRNTLWTLIGLFGAYLAFEFYTLWLQDFPEGFYYAGYAHQGAAWLTFALALATGLLSAAFSGRVLKDSRLASLRTLSWIWSAQNFLLAVAVYNRLMIYVGYNGMTRMRTVGFFGITVVVIGFALVIYKIARNRGFWWLIRAQLIALVLTVIAYSLFPVDWVAHRYNASRVADGHLHPSVMIAVKPIEDEGIAPLLSLTNVDDPMIREGILAILAERQMKIEVETDDSPWHWTRYQVSTYLLQEKLLANQSQWREYLKNANVRRKAIQAFKDYAMQWY